EFLKTKRKEGEKKMKQKEKAGFFANIVKDVLSGSLWAFLLGFYGYIFVSYREINAFGASYDLTVILLIALLACYAVATIFGIRKKKTPGEELYILGMGIFLMNLGLAMDVQGSITMLYLVSGCVSVVFKLIDVCLLGRRSR
ncbi:MAG: hypothetical protein Q4B70_15525, partial [Lachnospiraceae bacterium]|nr:hypothetical protein [Lachnospiraceae bacterium]